MTGGGPMGCVQKLCRIRVGNKFKYVDIFFQKCGAGPLVNFVILVCCLYDV